MKTSLIITSVIALLSLTACPFDDLISTSKTTTVKNNTNLSALNLPPEPDEKENNKTLKGIDSNGDGVRDDIERYIKLNEPNVNLQRALLEVAEHDRNFYDVDSREKALIHNEKDNKISNCFFSIIRTILKSENDEQKKMKLFDLLADKYTDLHTMNYYSSNERIISYKKADYFFAGVISYGASEKPEIYCDFTLESMNQGE